MTTKRKILSYLLTLAMALSLFAALGVTAYAGGPAQLTVTGTTVASKTYDGTTDATATLGTVDGIQSEHNDVIVTPSATFADKNAGEGKIVTVTYALSGPDAGMYTAPANDTLTANITKREITLTSASATKEYDGFELTNDQYIVTGDGFATAEGCYVTVTGSQTEVGSSANTITYSPFSGTSLDNYNITKVEGTLQVTSAKTQLTVTGTTVAGKTYDGTTDATATLGTVSGIQIGDDVIVTPSATFADKNAGKGKSVTVTYALSGTAADKYTAPANDDTLTADITKREITLTSASATKEYDGFALANDEVAVTGDGFATDEGFDFTVTGSQTEVGSSANTFTYSPKSGTSADNYNITKVEGTLTVELPQLTVTGTTVAGKTYDGTTDATATIGTVSGIQSGDDVIVTPSATFEDKNAGTGKSVTVTYALSGTAADKYAAPANDTLTADIDKRDITLTSASATKEYDGFALGNDEVAVTGDDFATGEGFDFTVTGSQTEVGSSANTFTYSPFSNTSLDNYNITKVEGTLTVWGTITKANTRNGRFTVSAETATAGTVVTITTCPARGYEVNTVSVKDSDGNDVAVSNNQFTMPTKNVTVTVTFKATPPTPTPSYHDGVMPSVRQWVRTIWSSVRSIGRWFSW